MLEGHAEAPENLRPASSQISNNKIWLILVGQVSTLAVGHLLDNFEAMRLVRVQSKRVPWLGVMS